MNNKLKIFAVLTVLTVGFIGSASAQWVVQESTTDQEVQAFDYIEETNHVYAGLSGGGDNQYVKYNENLTQLSSTQISPSESYNAEFFHLNGQTYMFTIKDIRDEFLFYEIDSNFNFNKVIDTTVSDSGYLANGYAVGEDSFYIINGGDNNAWIYEFDTTDNSLTQIHTTNGHGQGYRLGYYNGGVYYFNGNDFDGGNNEIIRYDVSSGSTSVALGLQEDLNDLNHMVINEDGELAYSYRTTNNNDRIEVYDLETDSYVVENINGYNPLGPSSTTYAEWSENNQFLALGNEIGVLDRNQGWSQVYDPGIYVDFKESSYLYSGADYNPINKVQTSGVVVPPTATINSPADGYTKTVNYGESEASFNYDYSVNTQGLSTNYTIYLYGSEYESGTLQASGTTTDLTGSFDVFEGDHTTYIQVENSGGTATSDTHTFTVEETKQPEFNIISPEQNEVFYKDNNIGTGTATIPIEAEVDNSQETGTAFFRSGAGNVELGSIKTGNNDYGDTLTVEDLGSYSGNIDAEYSGGTLSSNSVSFDVEPGYPTITSYTVQPSGFSNLEVGDTINATVEGDITLDAVERVAFSLRVEGTDDPSDVVVDNIDFQDQNSYTHSEKNIYTLDESYQGREVYLNVIVEDTQGRENLASSPTGQLGSPPDEFKLNSPDPEQLFLIPEGDTETNVDIEYGVDTSVFSGTAELIVNGNVQDSFSVDNDTTKTATYSQDYSEGRYNWKVRFTDSLGTEYESNDIYFDVTDEPINLNLNSPQNGAEINLLDQDSTTVDHDFSVDSRALNGNYYYRFTLENTDTNTVLRNRTSTDFGSGQDSYTQTVSGLSNASYSWNVNVFRSSDNTLLESKSSSYTIVKEPLFDLSIDSPIDGSVYQVEPGNTTDVTVRYAVETYAEATDFTLERNGTVVDTKSVSQGTSNTFTTTLNSLSPDTYSLTLSGEDAEGNTNSTSVQFEVRAVEDEDSEEAVPEVYEAEFRPSIQDARVGDELDLYIEGTKFPEDVDFIDVKVETGAGTETFTVPGDQLNRQNSFNYTIENALTVTSAMLSDPATIFGSVQSVAGQVSSFFFPQGEAGESTTIGAIPNYPISDVSIKQPPGVSEDVRFDFNVNSLSQEVDYQVLVKDEGTPGYGLVGGSVGDSSLDPIPPNSNENVVMYRNLDNEIFVNESRGNFKWKVVVFTGDGSASDNSKEYSRTADFNIVDSNTTTLNFLNPSNNAELETPEASSLRDVSFDFNVDTAESGRLYLELYDDTVDAKPDVIYDRQVGSGRTPDSEVETLERGSYRAVLHFENENVDINRTRDFSVVRPSESTQCESPNVVLKKPTYDILYADSSYVFEWAVCNPNNYDEPSNTTLYIEDDEGNVQESFFEEYDTQGEVLSFSPRVNTDFPQGEYSTYANYSYPNTTIQSTVKDFQIVDFTKPESFDLSPDGRSFKASEEIPISWTTQAYEENVEATAKVKRVGEYQSNTVKVADISSNSEQDFSDTITREAGEYEFFVDMEVSPEGSASPMTFQSNKTTFEVTSVNLSDADFTLIEPEQGAEYDVPNGSQNASVPFAFDVGVTGEKNWKIDLLVQDVGEETGFVREERFTLPGTAGTGSFNTTVDLNESGYRYRIRAIDPNSEESLSEIRSFVVDDPETEEIPEVPNPDPDEGTFENAVNFISAVIGGFASIVGTAGLFFVATLLTVASGTVLHLLTDSNGISLLSMLTTVVFFVGIGWYPGWVGMILFLGSAAIFMIGVRKVTTGGGS